MDETEALALTPPFFMVFPLFGALAVATAVSIQVIGHHRRGVRTGMGTIVLPLLIIGILAFLATWCALGWVDATDIVWIQASVVLTLAGVLLPLRDAAQARMDAWADRHLLLDYLGIALRFARDAALICIAALFARNALEVPWNTEAAELGNQSIVIEYAVIVLLMATTFFVGQRTATGPVLVALFCVFAGIAQSFLLRFKGAPILPSDLLALNTAAEVADQYTYVLTDDNVRGILYAALSLLPLCFLRPLTLRNKSRLVLAAITNVVLALPFALALDWWIEVPRYRDDFGYSIYYWTSDVAYRDQGFVPTFMTAVQDLEIQVPEGYTTERAEDLLERYAAKTDAMPERSSTYAVTSAQFEKEQPSVVVVMNETFCDLSLLDELGCGYEGPTFFKGMSDTLARGNLGVSVYGAGTCNTEFELLTGNGLTFLGAGKYPYQMYDFDKVDNLARQFGELGYQTTAIHPNLRNNWNRSKVYSEMGFDRFISIDDYPDDTPTFHSGITDKATYQTILDILSTSDEPQFIHDVTMQNHGGWDKTTIPDELIPDYKVEAYSEAENHRLNVFLSCIQASDEDLEWFVGELRKLDRPVVLAFFGDHHPGFSNTLNDRLFPGEFDPLHRERIYQTSYIVWANYDVVATPQRSKEEDMGVDFLAARTLDMIGAPLTDFQKAQLSIHKRLPTINVLGYRATDGRWHAAGTSPYCDTTYRDIAYLNHLNFGSKFESKQQRKAHSVDNT